MNHLVLEHLSGVKGGCPLEEAYYLKLSLFKALSTFYEVFLCYIDIWFLTEGLTFCHLPRSECDEDQQSTKIELIDMILGFTIVQF